MKYGVKLKLDDNKVELSVMCTTITCNKTSVVKERDKYLDVQTAAQVIGISKSRLYYLVSKRRINHFRKGYRIFFLKKYVLKNYNVFKCKSVWL